MAAIQKVARIRLDLNDFDGDRRGIAESLGEAEEALIEVVNRLAAMLQGTDGALTNEDTITATQFKPVADLYGLTSPTGSETSFTFDAVEARDFVDGGWSCQEYVELERFQEAVSGNSPVIPDGWVACSERMPNDKDYVWCWGRVVGWTEDDGFEAYYDASRNKWWAVTMDGEEPVRKVTHWQPLPAAPQQEAENV
ncbi:TPA: DUF551 domain-containing protein [Enterobacter hormaechei]|nr:DUF551 domain-containing protein [Enterobacter hormaechei]